MLKPEKLHGTVVGGRFVLRRHLGSGAFGWVYAAEQTLAGGARRPCAVKLLSHRSASEQAVVLREVEAMIQLTHPNLVTLFDAGLVEDGLAEGCMFLAMELGDTSLQRRLERPELVTVEDARTLACHIAEALAYLSDRGAVHRDVKPANVFRVGGVWKLGDFGLVRAVQGSVAQWSGLEGTPRYMAPESVGEPDAATGGWTLGEVGSATDMWAFGVMLQQVLRRQWPYPDGPPAQVIAQLAARRQPHIASDLPAPFDAMVRGCLQLNRKMRWTASRVLEELRRPLAAPVLVRGASPPAFPEPSPSAPLSPVTAAGPVTPVPSPPAAPLAAVGCLDRAVGSSGVANRTGSLSEIVSVMRPPLAQEERMGFGNAAVFGGVDAFVARFLDQARALPEAPRFGPSLDDLGALFADYSALTPAQRSKRVKRAQELLDALEGRGGTPAAVPGAGPTPTTKAPSTAPACAPASSPVPVTRGGVSVPPPAPAPAPPPGLRAPDPVLTADPAAVPNPSPPSTKAAPAGPRDKKVTADTLVSRLTGVGPKTAQYLERLDLRCVEDLLWHLPRRHEDRRRMRRLDELVEGETVTVAGTVRSITVMPTRTKVKIVRAVMTDGSGERLTLMWFNRTYLRTQLPAGTRILACGQVERRRNEWQVKSPEFEELGEDEDLHLGRIVPIYGLIEKVTQQTMRRIVAKTVLEHSDLFEEFLPRPVLEAQGLMPRAQAIRALHLPESFEQRDAALERLVFEELFVMQVGLALRRRETERVMRDQPYTLTEQSIEEFEASLEFRLTGAQRRVLGEVVGDLEKRTPMSRLIQGDVGSGKTVVAAFAAWVACRSGRQAAIMAPTEILAEQLSRKIQEFIGKQFSVRLLKGAMTAREKEAVTTALALGEVDVAVGTHALIQDDVRFHSLAMVVIVEPHKFGTLQRRLLRNKGYNPDLVLVTATPIPRTLALTVYGDLDVSIIDELPPGRSPIKSLWKPSNEADKIYEGVRRQVQQGRQVYIVCPLIEESETLNVAAATAEHARLSREVFPDLRLGLLHGRMKSKERGEVMDAFRQGEYDFLVSTSIIDSGIDVPNATVMVIQNADRFSLAQLHQLRSRVGRGEHQSYCVFVADPETEEGKKRMEVIASTTDGFQIAEEDMKFRGPGDFYGSRQSGLPDLRVADLVRDFKVLGRARGAAGEVISRDPTLSGPECMELKAEVLRSFGVHMKHLLS